MAAASSFSIPADLRLSIYAPAHADLEADQMYDLIETAIADTGERNPHVYLQPRLRCRRRDVYDKLRDWKPQLFQLYAHMASATDTSVPFVRLTDGDMTPMELVEKLCLSNNRSGHLKCVLLMGCNSDEMASKLKEFKIPYVIGTKASSLQDIAESSAAFSTIKSSVVRTFDRHSLLPSLMWTRTSRAPVNATRIFLQTQEKSQSHSNPNLLCTRT